MEQGSQRSIHLAIDGKVLKGTGKQAYGGDDTQKQVLHIYEVQTGMVLQQCPIATKRNARQYAQTLVDGGALQRTHSHRRCRAELSRRMARLVQRAGGDVVLFIKDNTPLTRADLALFFEDPEADRRTWQTFAQVEKGHGRLERRQIITSPDLNDYLARDWGEVGQVFRLQRERTSKDKHSVEVVYGWTSLPRKRCSAQELLHLTREHWGVENRLHWRRDVTLGEDRCGVRFPPVAQMLAVLNTVVLSLMDAHHVTNVARQIRRFASHPNEALAWLL